VKKYQDKPFADHAASLEQRAQASGSPSRGVRDADSTREALAIRIIDLAIGGERDINQLRDAAVALRAGEAAE
jgi:hypothetical protein